MTDAVLFDLDGVLLDSARGDHRLHQRRARELGEPRARRRPTLRRFVGPPLAEGFAELVGPERAGDARRGLPRRATRPRASSTRRSFDGMAEVLEDLGAQRAARGRDLQAARLHAAAAATTSA